MSDQECHDVIDRIREGRRGTWIGADVWRSRPRGQGRDIDFRGMSPQRRIGEMRCTGRKERKRLGGGLVQLSPPWGPQFFPLTFLMSGQDLEVPALCRSKNLVEGERGKQRL